MSLFGFQVSPFFVALGLFILVDALKVYLEIWNRTVRRSFTTDLTKVTALIPTHNGREVIKETVGDLIRAGLPRQQILVIDDGSTDDTHKILESLGVRFHRIPNMGKVSAINFGIHRVQTPYVLLLDDDTRIGDAKIPTSLLDHFDAAAFNVVPDRRDRHGPKGSGLISCLQRYEYCKSMEIGRRFQDGTASISCVSGAIGLFKKERLQAFHHKHTGVFQGEDLQRTIIELMNQGDVVFVDETVWTVVPDRIGALARQRILYWYPAHYHMFTSYLRLLAARQSRWRLRHEMLYNVFVVVTDPFRFWSLLMLFWLRQWQALGLVYVLYLLLEIYPFFIIQKKVDSGFKYLVLLLYPVFGLGNAALRTLSWFVWAYKRFITGEMRRKSEKDRKWTGPAAAAVLLGASMLIGPAHAAAAGSTSAPAKPLGTAIVQWDHMVDSNDNTFEDFWGFLSYKQVHGQVWYGDFTKGGEFGGYVKDHRRSSYAGLYRYRKDFDHVVQFDTEQILKKGFVAAGMLRGIHVIPANATGDRNMVQVGAGMDYYWGDYNFLSVRAISDPREGGRWSFVTSHRFQPDLSFYIQPGIILHTDGSAGWFLQGRYKIFRWGAGKYDRFDFTEVDRTVYSAGLEWTY